MSEIAQDTFEISASLEQEAILGVETPEMLCIDALTREIERKHIVEANLRVLQKRFGETFVKGNRGEDGEYLGGGAREYLASFMEIPDFAQELKRLIPNTHQALKTLQDNTRYILAYLEMRYSEDEAMEHEITKDPYVLAMNAGFELRGPFNSPDEFWSFAQDYRTGERICTFADPAHRLSRYHILWLRRKELDTIMPADMLTQRTLTDIWKDYLRTIGRYNAETDVYDLDDLQPAREDPYGTSSMSVQISRRGNHVSIKNRYNHTISSPDNTYGNNLDNIAYGLKASIYEKVDRGDLLRDTTFRLKDGYILDNNGGIHAYYYEKDNIYYGEYEYIENGIVSFIDKGAYDMLSPELYIHKHANNVVSLHNRFSASSEISEGGARTVSVYREESNSTKDIAEYQCEYDERGMLSEVSLRMFEGIDFNSIILNPFLTSVFVGNGVKLGAISNNPKLASIVLSEDATALAINHNSQLTKLIVAERARVSGILHNPSLKELVVAEGARIGDIFKNPSLEKLVVAENVKAGDIQGNSSLKLLVLAEGSEVGIIGNNPSLEGIYVSEGATTQDIMRNQVLTKIDIAKNTKVDDIWNNPSLKELVVAERATAGSISDNESLGSIVLATCASTSCIINNSSLISIVIARGARVTSGILNNKQLSEVTLAESVGIGKIYGNDLLNSLSVKKDSQIGQIERNSSLDLIEFGENVQADLISNNSMLRLITFATGSSSKGINYNPSLRSIKSSKRVKTGLVHHNGSRARYLVKYR